MLFKRARIGCPPSCVAVATARNPCGTPEARGLRYSLSFAVRGGEHWLALGKLVPRVSTKLGFNLRLPMHNPHKRGIRSPHRV